MHRRRFSKGAPWIALLAMPFLAAACSGSDESPLPKVTSAVAERDVIDGKAKLTSTVKVTLDRDFELAETTLPFASLFEFQVPKLEGGESRVLVKSAEPGETNTRLITLTAGQLIPEGSTLTIQRQAFQRKATGFIEAEVTSDLDPPLVVLASRAFVPTADTFFDDPQTAPLTDADRDPAATRMALEDHLRERGSDDQATTRALGIFDTIPVEIVPSPKLRAALAALTGTFAQGAIDSFLTAENCTGEPARVIAFQEPPGGDGLIARVTYHSSGPRIVSISPLAEGERIEHLMPILAHEAIHCDKDDGLVEEVAAGAFESFLYLQLVAAAPELATVRTVVARELNTNAVAMINSGQRFPESFGVLQSPGVETVLPLTNSEAGSFADVIVNAYPQITQTGSDPETVAVGYAGNLAEASGFEPGDPFDIRYLDELVSRATDGGVLAAAIIAFELAPV